MAWNEGQVKQSHQDQKGEPGYGRKKFKVFVMANGKVKKVMFGDPNMEIRKDNPKARASFRA